MMVIGESKNQRFQNSRTVLFSCLLLIGCITLLGDSIVAMESRAVRAVEQVKDKSDDEAAKKTERITKANKLWSENKKKDFGSISGRVFAITKGGDVKPARYAVVVIIPSPYISVFAFETLQSGVENLSKNQSFEKAMLLGRRQAVLKVAEQMNEELGERVKGFVFKADLEGNFQIGELPPGEYMICVVGRAGANEAVWISEINLKPRENLKQEMHSPEYSILKLD